MRLRRVLCAIGVHDWWYFNRTRVCDRCGKFQKIDLDQMPGRTSLPPTLPASDRRVGAHPPTSPIISGQQTAGVPLYQTEKGDIC